MKSRNSYVEINIDNYYSNLDYIKNKVNTEIMAVVKSNAYGCGLLEMTEYAMEKGVKRFAVAFFEEAQEILSNKLECEILILNYLDENNFIEAVTNGFRITLYSYEQIIAYYDKDKTLFKKAKYHLYLNTGMNNIGCDEEEAEMIIKFLNEKNVFLEGIYSHFSSADSDDEFTLKQYICFKDFIEKQILKGIDFKEKHISNSAAIIKYGNRFECDYVRSGMALYGLQPEISINNNNIKNVITWKSIVAKTRYLKSGDRISYGKNYIAEKDIKIAVIPIGYGDGYKMAASNRGYVLINGRRCNIRGMVCMDQITVECDDTVKNGDEVILIGEGIRAEEVAAFSNTIADDIVCSVSNKIPRIYKKKS